MGCAMATQRYYKKLRPENPVQCSNGMRIKFTTLDHLTGYFATENEYLHSEFARHIAMKISGITDLTTEDGSMPKEFLEQYVEKKKRSPALKPLSREEMGQASRPGINPIEVLGSSAVRDAVAVKADGVQPTSLPVTMTDAPPASDRTGKISTPTPEKAFQPPVGKRFAKRQPAPQ